MAVFSTGQRETDQEAQKCLHLAPNGPITIRKRWSNQHRLLQYRQDTLCTRYLEKNRRA